MKAKCGPSLLFILWATFNMVLQNTGIIRFSELRNEYGQPAAGSMILLGKYYAGGAEYGVKPAGAPNVTATASNLIKIGQFYGAFKVIKPILPPSIPSWTANSSGSALSYDVSSYQSANRSFVGPLSWSVSPQSLTIDGHGVLRIAQFAMLDRTLAISVSGQGGSASTSLRVAVTSYDPPVFLTNIPAWYGNSFAGPVYYYASSYLVSTNNIGTLTCTLSGVPAGVSVDTAGTITVKQGSVLNTTFTIAVNGTSGSAGSRQIYASVTSQPDAPQIMVPSSPYQAYTDTMAPADTVINEFYLSLFNAGMAGNVTWSWVGVGLHGSGVAVTSDGKLQVKSRALAYPLLVVEAKGPTGLNSRAHIPCLFFPNRHPYGTANTVHQKLNTTPTQNANGNGIEQYNPYCSPCRYAITSQTGTANIVIANISDRGCNFYFDTNNTGSVTVSMTGPDGGTYFATMTIA